MAPRYGKTGLPIIGVGGKPLNCAEGKLCCKGCKCIVSFTAEPTETPCCFTFTSTTAETESCGQIVSYLWDFGDGTTSTSESPTHCYEELGEYEVNLTVTDEFGCEGSSEDSDGEGLTLHCVDCEEDGPEASIEYSQSSDDPCCLQFSGSATGANPIVAWEWNFGDGDTSTEQNPSHCFDSLGPHTVTLTVQDSAGCTDSVIDDEVRCVDCSTVDIAAAFHPEQTNDDPCCIKFHNLSTTEAPYEITSYLWDFGDGDTSTEESPTHCFDDAGPHDITLTVMNDLGCTDTIIGSVQCGPLYQCLDSCDYPEDAPATLTSSGITFNPSMGGLCNYCTIANGITLNLLSAQPVCTWACSTGGGCQDCTDSVASGCTPQRRSYLRGSIAVLGIPGDYRIEASFDVVVTDDACAFNSTALTVSFRLSGLVECPHGPFSLPYLSKNRYLGQCDHDGSSLAVVIP